MAIAWNAEMTTGAAVLDSEHRRLIARFNALIAAVAERRDREAVERLLRDVGDAALRHFSRDEDCAMRDECPALEENGAARAEFLGIVATFRREVEDAGPTPEVAIGLERRLGDWVSRHIPGPDAADLPCVVTR